MGRLCALHPALPSPLSPSLPTVIMSPLLLLLGVLGVQAKVYDRCELARELLNVHGFVRRGLGDWICLVESESTYNTAATHDNGNGSRDYGLFQINDRYWCDANVGVAADCHIACKNLIDSDITDDITCVRHIFDIHGFEAWWGWLDHCQGVDVETQYVSDCF